MVPRGVRPPPGRGHQGPVELLRGRTRLLCHHPQAPTRPHVSSSSLWLSLMEEVKLHLRFKLLLTIFFLRGKYSSSNKLS